MKDPTGKVVGTNWTTVSNNDDGTRRNNETFTITDQLTNLDSADSNAIADDHFISITSEDGTLILGVAFYNGMSVQLTNLRAC